MARKCGDCHNRVLHEIYYKRNGFMDSECEFGGCRIVPDVECEDFAKECNLFDPIYDEDTKLDELAIKEEK